MKYRVMLGYLAAFTADVEVEADSQEEAEELALEQATQVTFTCEDEGGRTEVYDAERID